MRTPLPLECLSYDASKLLVSPVAQILAEVRTSPRQRGAIRVSLTFILKLEALASMPLTA